jgi:hypothetical protein
MSASQTRFITRCAQWRRKSDVHLIPPRHTRCIRFASNCARIKTFAVVYIGMSALGGIRSRLESHIKSKTKMWSHFSIFEVWDKL